MILVLCYPSLCTGIPIRWRGILNQCSLTLMPCRRAPLVVLPTSLSNVTTVLSSMTHNDTLTRDLRTVAIASSTLDNATTRSTTVELEAAETAILQVLPRILTAYGDQALSEALATTAAYAVGAVTKEGDTLSEQLQYRALDVMER